MILKGGAVRAAAPRFLGVSAHLQRAAIVVVAGALVAGWLLWRQVGGVHEPRATAALPYQLPWQQLGSFAVLRTSGPETPRPALKLEMERTVEPINFGLVYRYAQLVHTATGADAWVIPGHGYMCVLGGHPIAAGCDTTSETIRHGMSVVAISPSHSSPQRYLLLGLAPDRAREAIIEAGDSRYRVPIVNNVYAVRASTMPRSRLLW
jgi:hypothetical protein